MSRFRIIIIAVAALAWIVVGLLVARGPQPEIIVPAEVITKVGFLNISNTMISAWAAMIILAVGAFLATRTMKLIPSGAQNFVESVIEFLMSQLEDIAGSKNARRFFPVIATFFIFILLANWMGLLPFFNAIGKTEDIGYHLFHEIEEHHAEHKPFDEEIAHASGWLVDDTGIGLVRPNAGDAHFSLGASPETPVSPEQALDKYVVFLAQTFVDFDPEDHGAVDDGHGGFEVTAEMLTAAIAALNADPDAPKLLDGDHDHGVASAALGDELIVGGIDFPGQKLALIIPLFRSVYSDVNNTLALALISFVMVEFWGFRTLGFSYLGKFFNFSGLIPFFVGILELLSEFIRIISFAFRLFGNIFAGEVLILMLTFLLPFLIVDIIYGLELFVGFIQAAVFALLTLVFAVMAVEHHDEEHEGHEGEAGHDNMESQGTPGQ
ncbi:MAG: F0F1 ATP synthase subunit A [Chloroflexi bacterium]|nr:F0F1 ATP synthase subunit A [Chloroflexota bacterium]